MGRQPRLQFSGAIYHVITRGNNKHDVFSVNTERKYFLNLLSEIVTEFNWSVFSYCLMSNHYHLIIQTPDANLSDGMMKLNGFYSKWFNCRHKRVGHAFQKRYDSPIIKNDEHLLVVLRYIALNPVEAGIVKRPEDWKWSSFKATIGKYPVPEFLQVRSVLEMFPGDRESSIKAFKGFINSKFESENNQVLENYGGLSCRPSLSELFKDAYDKNKRRDSIKSACQYFGYSNTEVADFLGLSCSTIGRIIKNA